MGFKTSELGEVQQAIEVWLDKELAVYVEGQSYTETLWPQICLMSANKTTDEF